MKRSFCIIAWNIGSLAATYVAGLLLLKLVLVVLGVTVQDGKLIQALPYAVSLVVRGVWILIEAVIGIIFLVLGVKGKLPGTKRNTGDLPAR